MAQVSIADRARESADFIRSRIGSSFETPKAAIICGSGLSGLAHTFEDGISIEYDEIPHFAVSTVAGHGSRLVFGKVRGTAAVAMVGRFHLYEGHAITTTTFPVRVFAALGVSVLIATNAAGGLNHTYNVGDLVCLNDHISLPGLVGINPLVGPNDDTLGPRFPPLSDAYDLDLRRALFDAADEVVKDGRRKVHEGVYVMVSGPSYETRAESRMLRAFGADVVGMSTVPEIVVARHAGLRVLAVSLVTNNVVLDFPPSARQHIEGADMAKGKADHAEVLEAGREAAKDLQQIISIVIASL
ncbi:Purine nucleoside phosphorylase [Savitreella phatthalungensis]